MNIGSEYNLTECNYINNVIVSIQGKYGDRYSKFQRLFQHQLSEDFQYDIYLQILKTFLIRKSSRFFEVLLKFINDYCLDGLVLYKRRGKRKNALI